MGRAERTPDAFDYGGTLHVYAQGAKRHLIECIPDHQSGNVWNAYDVTNVAGSGAAISGTPDAISF
jgi:hypothetical protein